MVNINKLLGQFISSGAATGLAGGVAGGLASSLITSKSGRKFGKSALKIGGVAAVGALAYSAFKRYQAKQSLAGTETVKDRNEFSIQPAPVGSAFLPNANDKSANDTLGLTLIRAMIAASRSDGTMDGRESLLIFQKIETLDLDESSKRLLVQEMNHPVDMDKLLQSATCPEVAAEIYTASRIAIGYENMNGQRYLNMLSARLGLPPELVAEIDQQIQTSDTIAA